MLGILAGLIGLWFKGAHLLFYCRHLGRLGQNTRTPVLGDSRRRADIERLLRRLARRGPAHNGEPALADIGNRVPVSFG
jgi:hypothetical protein